MVEQFLSTRQVCLLLSFSLSSFFTPGGHRRFSLNSIRQTFAIDSNAQHIVCYSRVSSHDQKKDLVSQEAKLIKYSQNLPNFNNNIISITDLGSGLNYKKKGLNKLISMIFCNQVNTLVLNHKDRLLRFLINI
ncbi:MAG: recombinase family protein [Candidatus Sericytochromatia bacterium]|nr:recombinase family protein [Candidatus Sericytochromatia bacterium]